MAGLTSLLYTARDGLAAQTFGLNTTGSNVTNANTPGYVRRQVVLQTSTNGGVQVGPLVRTTDQFIDARRYESTGLASGANEEDSQLANVQALFNDTTGNGIGTSLDALFASFSALSATPSDTTARQTVLARASDFAGQLNDTANSIAQQKADIVTQAQGVVQEINTDATDIATLNQSIAQASAQGQDAADLRDQLATKVQDLATLINVHTLTDAQGNLVVQAGGTTLVQGNVARSLSVGLSSAGTIAVSAATVDGSSTDITSYVTGGRLSGLMQSRDVDLAAVSQKLDQFTYDVATAINGQHAAGAGLDGVSGRPLFSIGASATDAARTIAVDPSVLGQPDHVAAASSSTTTPGGSDNAVALAAIANQAIANGGTQTASDAYSAVLGDVASRKAQSADAVKLRGDVDAQMKTMQQSTSGVSLDEEMVNMTTYQRAYEASTKVLTTADQLLAELMTAVSA